jgi:microcystin degradation protein MlrC
MRIFVAGLITETNTFAPWPTGRRGFEESGFFRGNAGTSGSDAETALIARLWRELAAQDGHEVVESILAFAQPSGPTIHSVYKAYRDEILSDFESKGPFDFVLLFLHGAMVSTECDDCEGDLISRLRAIASPGSAIGAVLDLHCHLTDAMLRNANVIITVKEYPHIDFPERSRELYNLCHRTAKGEIKPVSALFDCRMVGFYPTTSEPMRGLTDWLFEVEKREGVLSVSFGHGFPWGDTPDTGSRVIVITDNDLALAQGVAEEIGLKIYNARNALLPRYRNIERALFAARESNAMSVLADTADNAGGGAPSDNVSLLEAMLKQGTRDAAFGAIWDPITAETCAEAGVGTKLQLRLGGKAGAASGMPLDVTATVKAVHPKFYQTGLSGSRVAMGLTVWIEVDGIDVVVNSKRTQVFCPDAFTGLGIDLSTKRIVVVKSSQHYQAGFGPLTETIIPVATPGAIQMNFAEIDYKKKRDMDYFPRVADPLGRDK